MESQSLGLGTTVYAGVCKVQEMRLLCRVVGYFGFPMSSVMCPQLRGKSGSSVIACVIEFLPD